jgi:hypothetical protein
MFIVTGRRARFRWLPESSWIRSSVEIPIFWWVRSLPISSCRLDRSIVCSAKLSFCLRLQCVGCAFEGLHGEVRDGIAKSSL